MMNGQNSLAAPALVFNPNYLNLVMFHYRFYVNVYYKGKVSCRLVRVLDYTSWIWIGSKKMTGDGLKTVQGGRI